MNTPYAFSPRDHLALVNDMDDVRPGDTVPAAWTHDDESPSLSVGSLFESQVVRYPHRPALKWGDDQITYAALNRRANQLAHALRERGVGHETPVGVFMRSSIDLIVALLAVNKAGGTYIPMDLTQPDSRLQFMVEEVSAPLVLTHDAAGRSFASPSTRVLNIDAHALELARAPAHNTRAIATGESRLYIRYTSGSTGRPKGIEVLNRGITRLMHTKHMPVDYRSRVSQVTNPSFDVFAHEVWTALLNGALLIGVSRDMMLDPSALAEFIKRERLTTMLITTAVFNHVSRVRPDAFAPLEAVVVGGEALVPRWIKRVLDHGAPRTIINGYGPTETSAFATFHVITEVTDDAASIPIGRPFNGSTIHILDDELRPVPVGERGEIYIGGTGVARGYVNRPELTAQKFIDDPFTPGERLYRSGDLGRWLPSGVVDFIGRADNQVKIRSFRVELGDIEAVLQDDPLVAEVVVLALDDVTDSKRLVAYIVPKDAALGRPARCRDAVAEISSLRRRLHSALPPYMHPSAYAVLERMPLTNNRKVDRKRLAAQELLAMDDVGAYVAPATETERFIAALWAELLGVERVSIEADWGELGGTSLLAAQQLLRIQERFDTNVFTHLFFENATVKRLARQVDELLAGSEIDTEEISHVDLNKEAHLDPRVQPDPHAPAYKWRAPDQVLVTGATGFLAPWIVRDLLDKTDATVYCLVRAADADAGMKRLRDNMRHYGVWKDSYAARVIAVPGDLATKGLGIPRQDYIELAGKIDTIFHSAAHVNYVEPYSWHKPTNVDGTVEMIRFAFHSRIKTFHHLSTISLFGPNGLLQDVKDVYEDTDIGPSAEYLHLDMGYSQSKWVSEQIIFEAQRRGLPVNLYRSGFILGDSTTGVCNIKDFVARVICGCVELGRYPLLERQRKEFVTVDYASAALVHIAHREDQVGKRFHLVPGANRRSVELTEFFELIQECGYALEQTEYGEWAERVRQLVLAKPDHALMPLLPALAEYVYEHEGEQLTRWDVYRDMPVYHCENTDAALEGSGIEFVNMDRELLLTYLEYLRERGLLPRPNLPDARQRASA